MVESKKLEDLLYPSLKGRFVKSSPEPVTCPDPDCKIKTNLVIQCPVCREYFHEFDEIRSHFEVAERDDEDHQRISPFKEIGTNELADELEITIKRDIVSKTITFLNMLNAQTLDDQFNIIFSAESSSGKSYNALECAQYFPEREVLNLAGASPTAFVHENGVSVIEKDDIPYDLRTPDDPDMMPVDELIDPLDVELDEIDQKEDQDQTDIDRQREIRKLKAEIFKKSKILVNMEGKIIIFIDQPNSELLKRVRPFLSHDAKCLQFNITDKSKNSGNRTKHVILRGFASIFFCSANSHYDDQEATRTFLVSPETNPDKLWASIQLLTEKYKNKELYYKHLDESISRKALVFRVELIRARGIHRFEVSNELAEKIQTTFKDMLSGLNPRHTRDYARLWSLIYAHALLNCFNRQQTGTYSIQANEKDANEIFGLYQRIKDANELGLSPNDFDIFNNVIIPAYNQKVETDKESKGLTNSEITNAYYQYYHRSMTNTRRYALVKNLLSVGLLEEGKAKDDGRKSIYIPTISNVVQSSSQKIIVQEEEEGSLDDTQVQEIAPKIPLETSSKEKESLKEDKTTESKKEDPPAQQFKFSCNKDDFRTNDLSEFVSHLKTHAEKGDLNAR